LSWIRRRTFLLETVYLTRRTPAQRIYEANEEKRKASTFPCFGHAS
jgi:hypothetical protein